MHLLNDDLQNGSVIFDIDGVLIDSEPFWQEADIEVFKNVNIELVIEKCRQTTGMSNFLFTKSVLF